MGDETLLLACRQLHEQIQSLPGWSLRRDLGTVLTARRILHGNFGELKRTLCITDDAAAWFNLLDLRNQEASATFRDEIDRLLHNFLSAAYTLSATEYKIAQRRWPKGSRERDAFDQETPYLSAGVSAFVFGLRHATQHERIPFAFANTRASQVRPGEWNMRARFTLSRDDLLALDWTSDVSERGRAYLTSLDGDPDIRETVEEFMADAWRFTTWIHDTFHRVYREEFRELHRMEDELARVSAPFRTHSEVR